MAGRVGLGFPSGLLHGRHPCSLHVCSFPEVCTHMHHPGGFGVRGLSLFPVSCVFKAPQSLLIHLHCLEMPGLQIYVFGIKGKKMASNAPGISECNLFAAEDFVRF